MTEKEMLGNHDFKSVIMYARNQNKELSDAHFIGAGLRPKTLGYEYRLWFMATSSQIIQIEIYY